jgi:HEAT repeat protein
LQRNAHTLCWFRFVLSLFGSPLSPQVAANLAVALLADGSPDAVAASMRIETVMRTEFAAITLTEAQRRAVLSVLHDLEEGTAAPELLELRAKVVDDRRKSSPEADPG